MRRSLAIFTITLIFAALSITFQNCAKKFTTKSDLSSITAGTGIGGLNFQIESDYSAQAILVSPTPTNPQNVTMTAATNSDVPELAAPFYSGSYLMIVPGQTLFLKIQYPASFSFSGNSLFFSNNYNGVAQAKASFNGVSNYLYQLEYYRSGSNSVSPGTYSWQLQVNANSSGALVAQSNVINAKLAPLCIVNYDQMTHAQSDSFTISVSDMSTENGNASTGNSIGKFLVVPVSPSGAFTKQIVVSADGTSGSLNAALLNRGANSFRLIAETAGGDVICGSTQQSVTVTAAASPSPTPILECSSGVSQTCTIANGTGTKTCSSAGSFGSCQNITCNSGYAINADKTSCGKISGPDSPKLYGANNILRAGEKLISANGQYTLVMQNDCNLVLYHILSDNSQVATFSTNTAGASYGCYATLQTDANFAMYTATKGYVWSALHKSTSYQNAAVVLQDDGRLVIFSDGANQVGIIWSSN